MLRITVTTRTEAVKGYRWMNLAEVYERVINWPSRQGIAVALGVAAFLVIAGFVLSLSGSRDGSAAVLGIVGLVLIMVVLWSWSASRPIIEKPSDSITVTTVPVFRADAAAGARGR